MSNHASNEVARGSRPAVLHLRPRSASAQRVWHVGDERSIAAGPDVFRLAVLPDAHESFASLTSIAGQLKRFATSDQLSELDRLQTYMREACPDFDAEPSVVSHGRFLADSVTLAIMRRISRESVYTARVIDTGARVINSVLSQVSGGGTVVVPDVDRLDRPTVKVLARAMLLLEPSHRFSWLWHTSSDPTGEADPLRDDPYVASRRDLLRKLVGILSPQITRHDGVVTLRRPNGDGKGVTTLRMASALVVQNYDACFLWADALLASADAGDVAECFRLRALAAVNVGMLGRALRDLHDAESTTSLPGRRAHLCYLQGLIEAKRHYSLVQSGSHYERGLALLDAVGRNGHGEDVPLERGWLLNGLALNEAIQQRRDSTDVAHHARAVRLEHEAFMLVRDGTDGARAYLRFNLLANCALLMEMQKDYDHAIEIFTKTFDFTQAASPAIVRRSRRTVGYRAGVLHYRAGRIEEAYRLLQDAAAQDGVLDSWATQERILRALGCVALARGTPSEAADVFAKGLDICRRARSAEGTEDHARGLCAALRLAGEERRAKEVADMMSAEEGVIVESVDRERNPPDGVWLLRPPSPKLPAYIPEIDLEGIPAIDINRYLGDAVGADAAQAVPWRA